MLKGAGGLTFQIVNKTEFSNIVTFVPSIGEQKKIGYLFYKLDNLITLHQRKENKRVEIYTHISVISAPFYLTHHQCFVYH